MRIKTYSTYVEFYEDKKKIVICRISYKELGIDINSKVGWDENILFNLIIKGYKNLKPSHQQLDLFS